MKKQFFTLAVLLSMCGVVNAQSTALTLTLDKAIAIALDENPTLKVADLEIQRYDYVLGATRGNLYPQLSITGDYSYAAKTQQMSESMQFSSDGTNTVTATANLGVALYAPAVYATLKMNRIQITEAVEAARGSQIDLVAAVKSAFYGTLLAQESLRVLEESSTTAKEVVDETQVKFDNELSSEYDLLTAQVQYNNLQPSIIQTRNSIELAILTLKMYLSIPEDVKVNVEGSLTQMREQVFVSGDTLNIDIDNNSSLKTLEIQSELLAQQLKLNKTAHQPTLSAFVSAYYTGTQQPSLLIDETGFVAGPTTFFDQFPVYAGLSLTIPIFSGLTTVNQTRQIRNQMQQLDLQIDYARQGVMLEAQSEVNNLLAARERMYAEEMTIAQAQKAYNISQVRYDQGVGTILELNSAQLSLTQAELNYSQAIYDFLVAKAGYDKIIGVEN
ncbi:MAG: TolC family protein [Rikenellaceae bacterium]